MLYDYRLQVGKNKVVFRLRVLIIFIIDGVIVDFNFHLKLLFNKNIYIIIFFLLEIEKCQNIFIYVNK